MKKKFEVLPQKQLILRYPYVCLRKGGFPAKNGISATKLSMGKMSIFLKSPHLGHNHAM